MRLFGELYDRVIRWSAHPRAPWFLVGLSFSESSFFPIPPDVMLAPMALAQPGRAAWFALLTTLASVAGGIAGYAIGYFAIELVAPLIRDLGYAHSFAMVKAWFGDWGVWVVFLAGFSPIPYKVFTIAAGAMTLALIPFTLASLFGRGARFFLVALLIAWGGARFEPLLRKYVDVLGWVAVALVVAVVLYLRL